MLKCKRNFDCLSLYENNEDSSYAVSSPYYPNNRKRVCNEFSDNMYLSGESLYFNTEDISIPKVPHLSPKSSNSSSHRSFSSPSSFHLSQNENLPNHSKFPKFAISSPFSHINNIDNNLSPANSTRNDNNNNQFIFNSPISINNNIFTINNNNNNNCNNTNNPTLDSNKNKKENNSFNKSKEFFTNIQLNNVEEKNPQPNSLLH